MHGCVSWHLACQFLSLSLPSSVFWTQGRGAASLLSPRDCPLPLPLPASTLEWQSWAGCPPRPLCITPLTLLFAVLPRRAMTQGREQRGHIYPQTLIEVAPAWWTPLPRGGFQPLFFSLCCQRGRI